MNTAAFTLDARSGAPWYRHPWPWFLMLGPAVVVVAGFATLWLAWRSDDGVVADDHYRRGLAINQTLARAAKAAALGVEASIDVAGDGRATLVLRGSQAPIVHLRLVHPTRAGLDHSAALVIGPDGRYSGQLGVVQPGRWLVLLETADWRIGPTETSGMPLHVDLGGGKP